MKENCLRITKSKIYIVIQYIASAVTHGTQENQNIIVKRTVATQDLTTIARFLTI